MLAITQAICRYRQRKGIDGPLFLGIDTHALSQPAASALEVLAANGVDVMLAKGDEYTPTPAVSHAILTYNRGRTDRPGRRHRRHAFAQPARQRRLQVQPAERRSGRYRHHRLDRSQGERLLELGEPGRVRRTPGARKALRAATTHGHDYLDAYVADLGNVIDFDAIRGAGVRMGVDPLGGAGVHYWARIAERYKLDLTVVSEEVDPTFGFMTLDWDGKIRMDPSSAYAMQRLIGLKDRYDIAFACDTDHDRHGIVTPERGPAAAEPLSGGGDRLPVPEPPRNGRCAAVGKTVVSSAMIDRVTASWGAALRSAGRLQMVRRRPARWLARLRRRGKRRRLVPAPRRQRVDDRQGRHRAGAAFGRDHGEDRPRPGPAVTTSWRRRSAIR